MMMVVVVVVVMMVMVVMVVVVVVRLVIMMVVVVMVHVRHHDLFDFDYRGRFMLTMVLKMLMILASTLCQRSGTK